jgi:ribulose-5-phosphate 4-epimerase/fuculose-1-phosphate aldolase
MVALKTECALQMNHGVLGVGRDLNEAFSVCELAEKRAGLSFLHDTG